MIIYFLQNVQWDQLRKFQYEHLYNDNSFTDMQRWSGVPTWSLLWNTVSIHYLPHQDSEIISHLHSRKRIRIFTGWPSFKQLWIPYRVLTWTRCLQEYYFLISLYIYSVIFKWGIRSLTIGWGTLPFLHMNYKSVPHSMYLKILFCTWKFQKREVSLTLYAALLSMNLG